MTIKSINRAKNIYNEIKKVFEEKITIDFWLLYISILNYYFDNRKTTIAEYIISYEKLWKNSSMIIDKAYLINSNRFGWALKELSKLNTAKFEFLLWSLPFYYANTMENIRPKDYSSNKTTRKLRKYILSKKTQIERYIKESNYS